MANTKQQGSAAQRREQTRQQRQGRLDKDKVYPKGRGKKKANNPWPMVIGILVMCVVVIGAFVWLSAQPTGGSSMAALKTIRSMDQNLLDTVGTGSAKSAFTAVPTGATIPKGATGKPQFLYIGADYCPYCAAQRWSVIMALSRFGSFGTIDQLTSSESNVPTFTFHNVKYASRYLDFAGVETTDNSNKALDTLTTEQSKLFATYDGPPYTTAQNQGAIPFILIGDKQFESGAFYSPQLLVGLTYDQINSKLLDSTSDISRGMLGTANYMTAAICQATNYQPNNVCGSNMIQTIEKGLPKATKAEVGTQQLAVVGNIGDMIVRRQD